MEALRQRPSRSPRAAAVPARPVSSAPAPADPGRSRSRGPASRGEPPWGDRAAVRPRLPGSSGALALVPALALALSGLVAPAPASAWTPRFQVTVAEEAARLAPPDLWRQIERHEEAFREGVVSAFSDPEESRHVQNPDGSGRLAETVAEETDRAVELIRSLAPFETVVHQLGRVSHYVTDLHNPLNTSDTDRAEGRYYADYLRYAESAEPRFPLVFYGFRKPFERPRDVEALARQALASSRELYPLVGREYRRIGFGSGVGEGGFDDRSTAFGVSSVAFSRAATDVAQVLRYVWLAAGGADPRTALPEHGGDRLVRVPRRGSGGGGGGDPFARPGG